MSNNAVHGFALIVGGSGGIGKEAGFAFAESGVEGICFADLDKEAAEKVAEESRILAKASSYKAFSVQVDVADEASVQNMVNATVKKFGAIHYCVNAAGVDVAEYTPFDDTSVDDYNRVLESNSKGAFLVLKAVGKAMRQQAPQTFTSKRFGSREVGRGSIVNVASALSFGAVPMKAPYITSKHALLGITRSAAMDLNSAGIRVNLVCPTWVDTPMFQEESRRIPPMGEVIKKTPAGRVAQPDEVASAIQFLSSANAAYITGTSILIDGGLSIGPSFF